MDTSYCYSLILLIHVYQDRGKEGEGGRREQRRQAKGNEGEGQREGGSMNEKWEHKEAGYKASSSSSSTNI